MASVDDLESVTAFAEKNEANFPILSDATKETSKAYGVMSAMGFAKRWTFYIDIAGNIAYIDQSVSPSTAGADLAANLERLSLGDAAIQTDQ